MKLKYEFVINDVAGQKVAVPVGECLDDFKGFLKMNSVGAEIFEILKEDVTLEEIVEKIMAKYSDATEQEVKETVEEFTSNLISAGIAE